MVNKEFVKDSKLKDILAYIKGINHSEQIRMMFFCSLNGLRCINFRCLQVKDVFNADGRSGGSGGNFYEWIISMDLDLINDYLHVYHYTPEQCNIFEVKDGENLTSSYFKYQ